MELQKTPSFSAKQITLGGLILVVGIVIGAVASFYISSSSSYQAGFDAAKALVQKSDIGSAFVTPDDVRILQGTVTAVANDQFTLHIQSVNPFDDPALADRTVLVSADTKLTKLVPKDAKTLQSEMDAFQKVLASGRSVDTTQSPQPFTSVTVDATDITVGDSLTVTSSENLRTLKEFTAGDIQILPKIAAN